MISYLSKQNFSIKKKKGQSLIRLVGYIKFLQKRMLRKGTKSLHLPSSHLFSCNIIYNNKNWSNIKTVFLSTELLRQISQIRGPNFKNIDL